MSETSTVVPGGDLAGRSAEYRRGYARGVMTAWPFHVFVGGIVVLALSAVGAIGTAMSRTDRAEARARTHMCIALNTDGMCHCSHYEAPRPALLPLTGGTITGQSLQIWSGVTTDITTGANDGGR